MADDSKEAELNEEEGANGEEEEEQVDTKGSMTRLYNEIPGLKQDFLIGFLFMFGAGFSMGMFAYIFKDLMNNFYPNVFEFPTVEEQAAEIRGGATKVAAQFIFVGLGLAIGVTIGMWRLTAAGGRISTHLRKQYFRSLVHQDISFFDQASAGALAASVDSQSKKIESALGQSSALGVQHFGEFVGGFTAAFISSWQYTLVLCAFLPLLFLAGGIQGIILIRMTSKSEDMFGKAAARQAELIGGVRTVKSLSAQKTEVENYSRLIDELYPTMEKKGWLAACGMGIIFLVMFGICYGFGMWYGSKQVANYVRTVLLDPDNNIEDKGFDQGELFGGFFGFIIGGMGIGGALPSLSGWAEAKVSVTILMKIIDRDPVVKPADGKAVTNPIEGKIELQDVKFHYPTRPDFKVFQGINIKINKGQTVALVGPSGCGKSTIIQLLERFYDPLGGRILVDDVEIHNYDLKGYRKQVGYVGQEPVLFDTTITKNIMMGLEEGEVTMEDVVQATKEANAYDFIKGFPEGFDTQVGEKGAQMSGGQKQRICIARALVRKPKVLLLDEATSALDTKSEAVVQAALDEIMQSGNHTVIVIAHRLSTVRDADKIVVIHEGKVMQEGPHDVLAGDHTGIYATMLRAQDIIGSDKAARRRERNLSKRSSRGNMDDELKRLNNATQKSNMSTASAPSAAGGGEREMI